jgi:hypothetical protein
MSEPLSAEQTKSTELVAALELLGPVAALWLEHLKGDAISAGSLYTGIGRVLRAKPPEDVRRHAAKIVVELLKSKEGRESLGYSMVYPDELCRQGIFAERQGYLAGQDLLDLISGRDDVESLENLVAEAFREFPSLAKEEDFIDLAENFQQVIKRTDKRIDFEIPRRELKRLENKLTSKDYAHLTVLASNASTQWWLKPLVPIKAEGEQVDLKALTKLITAQEISRRRMDTEGQRVRSDARRQSMQEAA